MTRSIARVTGAVLLFSIVAFTVIRQPGWRAPRYPIADRSDASILETHVRFLTTDAFPRSADHPESLDLAAAYIGEEMRKAGGRVKEQPFVARGHEYRNVIASFGPESSAPTIIIGAHYDAFGLPEGKPGADDNASGTAGLMELGRLLGCSDLSERVDLVAFTTEEPPFFGSPEMGSAVHAATIDASVTRTMICLEMIGYFTEERVSSGLLTDLLYPRQGNFIVIAGRLRDARLARRVKAGFRGAGGIRAFSFTAPGFPGLDASDHFNYWDRGITAVMVTDTAYLRNPNYHMSSDRAETLDYQRMAQVVEGVFNAVWWMAGTGSS